MAANVFFGGSSFRIELKYNKKDIHSFISGSEKKRMGKTIAGVAVKKKVSQNLKKKNTNKKKRSRPPGELGEGYVTTESIRKMGHRGGILSFRHVKDDNFFDAYRQLIVDEVRRYCRHIPTVADYHRRTTVKKKDVDYVIHLLDGERVYGIKDTH
jgi:hypothetical protein